MPINRVRTTTEGELQVRADFDYSGLWAYIEAQGAVRYDSITTFANIVGGAANPIRLSSLRTYLDTDYNAALSLGCIPNKSRKLTIMCNWINIPTNNLITHNFFLICRIKQD